MKTKSSSKLWKVGGKWFPQINVYKVVHQLLGVFLPLFSSSGWPEPESAEVATGHSNPLELETNPWETWSFTITEKSPRIFASDTQFHACLLWVTSHILLIWERAYLSTFNQDKYKISNFAKVCLQLSLHPSLHFSLWDSSQECNGTHFFAPS